MKPSTLAAPFLALALALPAAAADTVNVPRSTAPVSLAPPETRACLVTFEGLTPVGNTCSQTCYRETWEGPVLLVENLCGRTIWISYLFRGGDGRLYRTACYELAPRSSHAIEDTAVERLGHREVMIAQRPGPGFQASGFTMWCSDARVPDSETPVMK